MIVTTSFNVKRGLAIDKAKQLTESEQTELNWDVHVQNYHANQLARQVIRIEREFEQVLVLSDRMSNGGKKCSKNRLSLRANVLFRRNGAYANRVRILPYFNCTAVVAMHPICSTCLHCIVAISL